jgi:serine/threonine protein kinase/Flp pilus assembly protein TadD
MNLTESGRPSGGAADQSAARRAGPAEDDSRVIRALQEYQAAVRVGQKPNRQEFQARFPEVAEALAECLDGLDFLQAVAPHLSGLEAGTPAAADLHPEAPLGDFRILRELGRGGMGVVYEAVQISLGRRVALKVLPFASALDAKQLQRFKNEAQAAAHLHHTHVVPVYATGCERGVHFYAMQFIDGQSLAAVIQGLRQHAGLEEDAAAGDSGTSVAGKLSTERSSKGPAFFRTVATLAVQAAGALEHAHGLGVVHRDIKPANLLVDGQGSLWVTDFGLAQVQSDARLTLSGDVLGTLRYMSPEQALAQRVVIDHRTDLYSLGATLYELLTLEPVFPGPDRQELLRQIAFEEPRPLRRVTKAVPAELEIIVLKALAKEPAERYASARELADDLGRFLRDEPIRARRPPLVQRARKWARRHRPVVWSAAVSLLLALAVLAGSIGWIVRDRAARQARNAADVQAALEEARRFQGEEKWGQGQAAAERAQALLKSGGGCAERRQSVHELLADLRLVGRLEELRLLQAEVKEERFAWQRALSDYRQAFGDYGLRVETLAPEEAAAALRHRSPAVRAILLAALDHWLILARFKKAPEAGWLGRVLTAADTDPWRKRVRAARARNDRRALERLARQVDVAAQPPEELFLLDMSLRQRGATEVAVALLRRAQEAFPGDFWINHDLGMALYNCRPPQYEEAVCFLSVATALRPVSPGGRLHLGLALWRSGRIDEAAAAFRKAIDLKPDFVLAHSNLRNLCLRLGIEGRRDRAVAALRHAVERKPDYALTHYTLGKLLANMNRLDEAIAAYHQAIRLKPDFLAAAYHDLGLALARGGRPDEKFAAYRHDAACAAARAGCGRGEDAGPLDERQRARWRKQALAWLRADLAACTKLVQNGKPKDRRLVFARLRHWQREQDLAGLREPAAVAQLPAAEQETCQRFWTDVEGLCAQAAAAK